MLLYQVLINDKCVSGRWKNDQIKYNCKTDTMREKDIKDQMRQLEILVCIKKNTLFSQ